MTQAERIEILAVTPNSDLSLETRDRLLEKLRAEITQRQEIIDRLLGQLSPRAERPTAESKRHDHQIMSDVFCVRDGVNAKVGVTDPQVAALDNQFSLAQLTSLLTRHETWRADAAARQAKVWPSLYRYRGLKWKLQMDGRFVNPGEVVELTERQASGWGDLFEELPATELRVTETS